MNIATILFTYNRSYHTQEVVRALSQNTVLPKKLYIFQDGLSKEEHRDEWEKVNHLLKSVDFCPVELYVSEINQGVAQSIVSGIDFVLGRHDAVIVIEDDCVPSVNFVRFMEQCLEKYEANRSVWCIGGFNDPVDLKEDLYDVYGCGRTSSWGWGTWKNRWKKFSFDNGILRRLRQDEKKSYALATWGNDCEGMLFSNIAGRGDIWDAYWTLHMIEANGICVLPYQSLIENIGFDGTGTHCGVGDKFRVEVSNDTKKEFVLPDDIEIKQETKLAYVNLYGSHTAINTEEKGKEKVIVYGMGKFFWQYEKEINEQYYIEAFIDRGRKGWYAGKKIIGLNEMEQYDYDKVIIMVLNMNECFSIAEELTRNNIDPSQILLGHGLYGAYCRAIDKISVLADGGFLLKLGNMEMKTKSREEVDDAYKVFCNQLYNYHISNEKQDIVLDIGMHTGASTLYFLNRRNVEKVYGYESMAEFFSMAEENLNYYLIGTKRLEISQCETVEVEGFESILDKYPNHNMILKIDWEVEEERIIEKILQNTVLEKFSLVMLRWHHEEKDEVLKTLRRAGFSWRIVSDNDVDLIYAYK